MRKRYAGTAPLVFPILFLALAGELSPLQGQSERAIRDELLGEFDTSMRKFLALAEAMPAEKYTWSPGEGVMEVGEVFMHVARYNYLLPTRNMGITEPEAVEMDRMESLRDKAQVMAALTQTRDWVHTNVGTMTAQDLQSETSLFGRTVPRWSVLVRLVAHMNEHLGQSIAYARMNGVVPPWSR